MTLANVALTLYDNGWAEYGDLDSEIANGRSEIPLELIGTATGDEAQRITNQVILTQSQPHVASTAVIIPGDDLHTPYRGFKGLDTVTAPQPSGTAGARVRAISLATDRNRYPIWTLGLNGLISERDDQIDRLLRRREAGGLGGKTEASNGGQPASPVYDVKQNIGLRTFSKDGPLATGALESQDETLAGTYHLAFWTVTLTEADTTSDVEVELRLSGTLVETATIPSGTNIVYVPLHRELFVQTDTLKTIITDPGTDAEGLVSTVRYL